MKDAWIFDIDGTLADVSPFLHLLHAGPNRNYDAFHTEANEHALPHSWVVSLAHELAETPNTDIIVVTGRPARFAEGTQAWLQRHLTGIRFIGPLHRPEGDFRPDVAVKSDIIRYVVSTGYRIVGAVDDRPPVLAFWRAALDLDPIVNWRDEWAESGEHYSNADKAAWKAQTDLRISHGWSRPVPAPPADNGR